jgi:dCTP deaminase
MLSDKEIINIQKEHGMISPFVGETIREVEGRKVLSYGLSSYGYDLRLGPNMIEDQTDPTLVYDPKKPWINRTGIHDDQCSVFILPPRTMALGHTYEYIKMPENVMAICFGKSTYSRAGLIVNATPIEAGWEGQITLELFNSSHRPLKLYIEEGICQLIFFQGFDCLSPYATRSGKYQGQTGVTLGKV